MLWITTFLTAAWSEQELTAHAQHLHTRSSAQTSQHFINILGIIKNVSFNYSAVYKVTGQLQAWKYGVLMDQ